MDLYPAIDVRDGRAVRLLRGDYDAETRFGDPVEVAEQFAGAGAERLHVVDLDAARSGLRTNAATVAAMVEASALPVQLGGGIRSVEDVAAVVELGVERVVMGTAALEHPEVLAAAAEEFPHQVVLGLDYLRGSAGELQVAVHGWTVDSGIAVAEVLERSAGLPLAGVLATAISQDGTLEGPDLEGLSYLAELSAHEVLASGGVGSLDHLRALKAVHGAEPDEQLGGVIVGRALLQGLFTIHEAAEACR